MPRRGPFRGVKALEGHTPDHRGAAMRAAGAAEDRPILNDSCVISFIRVDCRV
jgi:hypothetical protein